MNSSGLRHCFCNLCKGNSLFSRYRIQKHVKLYGLCNDSDVLLGGSKKFRGDGASSSDSSNDSSDQEACGHGLTDAKSTEDEENQGPLDVEKTGNDLIEFENSAPSTEVRLVRHFQTNRVPN